MPLYRKLALYSDQGFPANEEMDARLLRLIGRPHPKIGYIPATSDPERIYFRRKADYYAGIGANLIVYVDPGQDTSEAEWSTLLSCDAIHLSGAIHSHSCRGFTIRVTITIWQICTMNAAPPPGSDASAIGLRPMVEGAVDRRTLFELYKLSLYEHIDQTFGWDESFQQERFNTSYRESKFALITLGSATVGYVALEDRTEEVHLSLLLLQPQYRSRGIGREVTQILMSYASDSERPLTLSCFLCNQDAMRFYERLGFSVVNREEHFVTYRSPD